MWIIVRFQRLAAFVGLLVFDELVTADNLGIVGVEEPDAYLCDIEDFGVLLGDCPQQ